MNRSLSHACLVVAAATLVACSETPDIDLGGNYDVGLFMPPIPSSDIDVLFVVDNSGSIAVHQQEVADKAQAALFEVIAGAIGGPPDLHVGVITSSFGAGPFGEMIPGCEEAKNDGGRLQGPPAGASCTGPDGTFIVDVAAPGGGRVQNYTGALADTFACLVRRGGDGCGFEQPFAALEQAVSGSVPENAGFLRDDAMLVVIFISDEDDCSSPGGALYDPQTDVLGPLDSFRCFRHTVVCDSGAGDGERLGCRARTGSPLVLEVDHVRDRLIAAKHGDASKVMVSVIAGDTGPVFVSRDPSTQALTLDPVCVDPGGTQAGSTPAIRLYQLLEAFRGRSWFESICQPDLAPALERTANAIGDVAARRPCLRGAFRDVDPAVAGVQPYCRAFATARPFSEDEDRLELAPCARAGADEACYRVVLDEATCGYSESHLRVEVEPRAHDLADRHTVVECLTPE